uniref:Cnidarian restricted protein n=1 Tax=Clytia hemisphaerica TaxID=252671 RepID=A0A7M5V665_9CNID
MNFSTLFMLTFSMLVVQALPNRKSEKENVTISVPKKTLDADQVEIPEEMFTAMKPITKYFFKAVKKLLTKSNTTERNTKQKTKKVSKAFFKSFVNPIAKYYGRHMKALRPLTSTVEEQQKLKLPTDPQIMRFAGIGGGYDGFDGCLQCHYHQGYDCMFCNVMFGYICCFPDY